MEQQNNHLQGYLLDGMQATELSKLIRTLTQAVERVRITVQLRRVASVSAGQSNQSTPEAEAPFSARTAEAPSVSHSYTSTGLREHDPGETTPPASSSGMPQVDHYPPRSGQWPAFTIDATAIAGAVRQQQRPLLSPSLNRPMSPATSFNNGSAPPTLVLSKFGGGRGNTHNQ
jgi:hypothetical protein